MRGTEFQKHPKINVILLFLMIFLVNVSTVNAYQNINQTLTEYKGEIIECDSNPIAREEMAAKVQKETGATFIACENVLVLVSTAVVGVTASPELSSMYCASPENNKSCSLKSIEL